MEENLPPKAKSCLRNGHALKWIVFVGDTISQDNLLEFESYQSRRYGLPTLLATGEGGDGIPGVSIKSFIEILSSTCLVSHIEERIRELEVVISSSRRGLKNQLKSLFFRKSSSQLGGLADTLEKIPVQTSDKEHSLCFTELNENSVEAAMRFQSDLLMMVGDYNTAISTLKLLCTDLKSDEMYFHYAAAQECLAAAHIISGMSLSSAISYYRESFVRYMGLARDGTGLSKSLSTMYCTRVGLQWSELLSSMGRFEDASWILMRAHFHESNMRAAFLLEYSAYLQMQSKPPKVRRYAFHSVLAALRYSQSKEMSLSSAAHDRAIKYLQRSGWDILEEHVHEALCQELLSSGNSLKALEHATAMVQCLNLPSYLQSIHMKTFIEISGEHRGNSSVFPVEIDLPAFDVEHLNVISAGLHTYHDLAARETPNRVWKEMDLYIPKQGGYHGRNASSFHRLNSVASCAGEDIILEIPVHNPMKIDLELLELEVLCGPISKTETDDSCSITSSKERLHLYPGESSVVSLKCRPLHTGSLQIYGLKWKLAEVPCKKIFRPSMSKWSLDSEIRSARGGPIEIQVLPPMPNLQMQIHPAVPRELFVGEVFECEVKLSNVGKMSLRNIVAVTTNDLFFLDAASVQVKDKVEYQRFNFEGLDLAVTETKMVRLFFRVKQAGHHHFNIIWGYEPSVNIDSNFTRRFLHFSTSIYVKTSFDLHATRLESESSEYMSFKSHGHKGFKLEDFILLDGDNTSKFNLLSMSSGKNELELQTVDGVRFHPETDAPAVERHFTNIETLDEDMNTERPHVNHGIVHWSTTKELGEHRGFTVIPVMRDVKSQTGVVGQICGPASLNHDFAKGTLKINLELRIVNEMSETIDAVWTIGQTAKAVKASSKILWKGHCCGIQHDILPNEKRFVVLEAAVQLPGIVQVDSIYINWSARTASDSHGSLKIDPSFITINSMTM